MSSTIDVTVAGATLGEVECAVLIRMGRPEDFFDHISACEVQHHSIDFVLGIKLESS
jgi:hypothetical protein